MSWFQPTVLVGLGSLTVAVVLLVLGRLKEVRDKSYAKGAEDAHIKQLTGRVGALEAKPAQDISVVAEKIKSDLERVLGDRIDNVREFGIRETFEVKQRVQKIEDARAAETLAELEAKNREVERLQRKVSTARMQAQQGKRPDPRVEPDSDEPPAPSDTDVPPPLPPRPLARRR